MRWLAGWLALLLLANLPTGAAQAGPPAASVISDPAGDVEFRDANQTVAPAGSTYSHLDIRSAWVSNETLDEVELGIRLERWEDPLAAQPLSLYERELSFHFSHGTESYVVLNSDLLTSPTSTQPVSCAPGQAFFARLDNEDSALREVTACVNSTAEPGEGIWRAFVPKALIKSAQQVPIQEGEVITRVASYARQFVAPGVFAVDRAPDEHHGPPFLLQEGRGERQGELYLIPTVPVRASNGESTTMVFPVQLLNRGSADDTVIVSTTAAGDDWKVRAPQRVLAPAGKIVTFPAILSMEFTHGHGETRYLELRGESTARRGDFVTTTLGVHWLEIPQPAGHHDRLWLHSAPKDWQYSDIATLPGSLTGTKAAWVNAIDKDPRAGVTDEPVPGETRPFGLVLPYVTNPTRLGYTEWSFPLSPGLQIGLDLDHARPGLLETRIRSTLPSTAGELSASLAYYCATCANSATELFSGQAEGAGFPVNGEVPFGVELRPNPDVDVVPYAPGSSLVLRLVLRHDTPQTLYMHHHAPTPQIVVRDSIVTLPLTEYHDPVDQAFQNIGTLVLAPLDPAQKQVNPGRAAAFRFDITNEDIAEHRLRVFPEGINAEWGEIVGDAEFILRPDERRQSTLLVRIPADAQPGERAELFFVAESIDDPSLVALSRVRASVVDPLVAELTDEAGILENNDGAGTPGLELLAALAAFGVAVIARRCTRE